jgi:hypothetical protein
VEFDEAENETDEGVDGPSRTAAEGCDDDHAVVAEEFEEDDEKLGDIAEVVELIRRDGVIRDIVDEDSADEDCLPKIEAEEEEENNPVIVVVEGVIDIEKYNDED